MRWKRDRLAGLATDTVLVGTLIALAFLIDYLRVSQLSRGLPVPTWLVVTVLVLLVATPVALYSTVERLLYAFLMQLLRPRLSALRRSAERLYESAQGHFHLDRLLEHLSTGLQVMEPGIRLAWFLPDEEEGAMVLEALFGDTCEGKGTWQFPLEGSLGRRLAAAPAPIPLPLPDELLPSNDTVLKAMMGGEACGDLIPLRISDLLTGTVLLAPAPGKSLGRGYREVALDLLNRAAVLIEDARLYSLARRESMEKDLLFEVGARISSTLDRDMVLELILDNLKKVVGYDAAAIFTVDPDTGSISRHLVRGYDTGSVDRLHLKVGKGLVGRAAELGKPILVPDVREAPDYVNAREQTRSEINLPVAVEGQVLAVISLASDRLGAYRKKDLKLLQVLGSQAAIAIQNAGLYEEARQKRNLEHELELAWDIQRALLPRGVPEIAGIEVASYIEPSHSVGGDLYDLVPLGDRRLGVAIGDISGKGTPAAILMASLYASFRSVTRSSLALPELMRRLNNLLAENVGLGRYATFCYAVIDAERMELRYSNAGHFPPLLLRAGEEPQPLTEGGIVLGYIADSEYREGVVPLRAGDLLLLYTDGLVEAENAEGELFGEERVAEVGTALSERSAREVLDGLREAARSHCGGCPLQDDLTIVVVRVG